MQPDTDPIVDGLLKWWHRRFPMGKGCRNPHAFKLAAACNDYGIPQPKTLAVLLRYVEQDFTAAEVRVLVRSAYRNTAAHGSKQWGGRGGGAPAPRPAYTPRLTPAQAKAVEDRLAEEFRARFAWKPWDMGPQQPAAEVGAMAAPAPPPPQPPPSAPPIIKSRAEVAIERMAEKNPEINLLVDLLQLDVASATVRKLTTT